MNYINFQEYRFMNVYDSIHRIHIRMPITRAISQYLVPISGALNLDTLYTKD